MRIANFALLLIACVTLDACNGHGGGSSNSGGGTSPPIMPTAPTSATTTITSSNTVAQLSGTISVDFSQEAKLFGTSVTIALTQSAEFSTVINYNTGYLLTDFPDQTVISVHTDALPKFDLPVVLSARSLVSSAGANSFPTLYLIQLNNADLPDDQGDGDSTMFPVPTQSNSGDGTVTAKLPVSAFNSDPAGGFVAYLKSGLAKGGAESFQSSTVSPAATTQTIVLPCPLTGEVARVIVATSVNEHSAASTDPPICTERSRFNPARVLLDKQNKPVRLRHLGMDIVASEGSPIYLPAGGTPVKNLSFTRAQYDAVTLGCPNCYKTYRAGVYLTIKYSDKYFIRILHLDSIDPAFLKNDAINESAITASNKPVATSGGTGAGYLNNHLHYEIASASNVSCKDNICSAVVGQVDPFPFLVSNFGLSSNNYIQRIGATYQFSASAVDAYGTAVQSQVRNAFENNGAPPADGTLAPYDPTRKICLSTDTKGVIQFTQQLFPGSGGSSCTDWTASKPAKALHRIPATTVTAKFSTDPLQSVAADPLSAITAKLTLSPQETECLSLYFVVAGYDCSILGGVAASKLSDFSRIRFTSDNPAIATTYVGQPLPGSGPPYLFPLHVVSGATAGTTSVRLYIDNVLTQTLTVVNAVGQD